VSRTCHSSRAVSGIESPVCAKTAGRCRGAPRDGGRSGQSELGQLGRLDSGPCADPACRRFTFAAALVVLHRPVCVASAMPNASVSSAATDRGPAAAAAAPKTPKTFEPCQPARPYAGRHPAEHSHHLLRRPRRLLITSRPSTASRSAVQERRVPPPNSCSRPCMPSFVLAAVVERAVEVRGLRGVRPATAGHRALRWPRHSATARRPASHRQPPSPAPVRRSDRGFSSLVRSTRQSANHRTAIHSPIGQPGRDGCISTHK